MFWEKHSDFFFFFILNTRNLKWREQDPTHSCCSSSFDRLRPVWAYSSMKYLLVVACWSVLPISIHLHRDICTSEISENNWDTKEGERRWLFSKGVCRTNCISIPCIPWSIIWGWYLLGEYLCIALVGRQLSTLNLNTLPVWGEGGKRETSPLLKPPVCYSLLG